MIAFVQSRLAPFKHKNFRYFFLVQTLSLTGQWSHDLARAWIILQLIGNASALGFLQMAIAIPSLLFILHGGVVVDRSDVKKIMIVTKAALATAALSLAFILEFSQIEFWMLLLFGAIEGCVVAFDSPAYQALTVRLVPREDFQQALALNSTNFHSARMMGPLVAGLLMAWHGPSLVFLFDGITYVLLIFVLRKIDLRQAQHTMSRVQKSLRALTEGFQYIYKNPAIFFRILQLFITISCMIPLMLVVFRTYIQNKFGLNAEQFGFVFTLPALGSMMGALSFTFLKPRQPTKALYFGIPGAVLSSCLVPFAHSAVWASVIMAFTGFSMYLSLASLTVSLHLGVQEEFRGRLGSVIGLGFMSVAPLMGLPVGVLADHLGFDQTIFTIASVFLLSSITLRWLYKRNLKKRQKESLKSSQILAPPVDSSKSEKASKMTAFARFPLRPDKDFDLNTERPFRDKKRPSPEE